MCYHRRSGRLPTRWICAVKCYKNLGSVRMKKKQTRKIIKFRHQLNTASPPLKYGLKHHSHTSRKYLQGWECHHQHHFSEEIFPDTQCKRPLAQLEAISSCSITRSFPDGGLQDSAGLQSCSSPSASLGNYPQIPPYPNTN